MKVEKWIHINYEENDKWLFPIFNALRESIGLNDNEKLDKSIIELSYHISTRLDILPIIYKRLNEDYKQIINTIKEKSTVENISSKNKRGFVLDIEKEIVNEIILDIDSFLLEINACIELITKLISKIYNLIENKIEDVNKEILNILSKKGLDEKWFRLLDSARNFFIHEGTPFFAVDYTNQSDGNYDILIMKKGKHS